MPALHSTGSDLVRSPQLLALMRSSREYQTQAESRGCDRCCRGGGVRLGDALGLSLEKEGSLAWGLDDLADLPLSDPGIWSCDAAPPTAHISPLGCH